MAYLPVSFLLPCPRLPSLSSTWQQRILWSSGGQLTWRKSSCIQPTLAFPGLLSPALPSAAAAMLPYRVPELLLTSFTVSC